MNDDNEKNMREIEASSIVEVKKKNRKKSKAAEGAGSSQPKKIKKEGIERAAPGIVYQVQLLMFFAYRGYQFSQKADEDYRFGVGKEHKKAGKFDDIIVRYKQNEQQEWNYLLVQVKHTAIKITTHQLLLTDNKAPFRLFKYFSSFIGSKKQYEVDNPKGKIESCVLATNTDFNYNDENPLELQCKSSEQTMFSLKQLESNEFNKILKIPEENAGKYYKLTDTRQLVEKLTIKFGKNFELIKKEKGTNKEIFENLKDIVNNREQFQEAVEEFLEKLIFAVNLPDTLELRDIMKKITGEKFLRSDDFIVDRLEHEMMDYAITPQPTRDESFLEGSDLELFFLEMKRKIDDLEARSYSLKIQNSTIDFINTTIKDSLTDFLDSQNMRKILTLTTESMFLTAIKICKILEESSLDRYSLHNDHIFLNLEELFELPDVQENLMRSFKNKNGFNLLVIVCNNSEIDKIRNLQATLYNVVRENDVKKVVCITELDFDFSWARFDMNTECLEQFHDSDNNFSDLNYDSRRELLDRCVSFQGERIALKDLYFKPNDELLKVWDWVVSDNQLDQLKMNATTLKSLMDDSIKIDKPFSKSDLEGAYNKFYEKVDADIFVRTLKAPDNRFFIISGIDGPSRRETLIEYLKATSKMRFYIEETQISEWDTKGRKLNTRDIKNVILADSEFKEEHFRELCHLQADQPSYWISWKDHNFVLRNLYYPQFFPREFKYPAKRFIDNNIDHLRTELFESDDDTVFFFTGVDESMNLSDMLKLHDQYDNSERIIIQKEDNKNKFNELVKKRQSVYWLHLEKDKKISCRDGTRETILEKKLVDKINGKSSILIDKPGMGKSTTLTILSGKMLKSHWVILITLRDWQEMIKCLPEDIDKDAVVMFLSGTNNLNTPLEENLAKHILDKDNQNGVKPLLLLFDGFDEIRSYGTENIGKSKFEKFLRFLKDNTPSTIWITAREHDANRLKNILSIFDIQFEPLDEQQKKQYFKNIWSHSLALSISEHKFNPSSSRGDDDKFERYYSELSTAASKILAEEDSSFMGIPLTLRLFAECFREKFKIFIDSNNDNDEKFKKDFSNFGILKLYEDFIDAKFKIFLNEKTNLSSGFTSVSESWFKELLIKRHHRLAFKEIFGAQETEKLLGTKQPFNEKNGEIDSDQLEELLNFGIIRSTKENHYEFLHRTFAEYFISNMFVYMLQSKEGNNPTKYQAVFRFIENNILRDSNKVIYKFLEARIVQENNEILNDKWQLIIGETEYKNLLGLAGNCDKTFHNRAIFVSPIDIKEDVQFLREMVKRCVRWNQKKTAFEYREGYSSVNYIEKLVGKCFIDIDIDQLKSTLEYLLPLFGKSEFGKFLEVLSEENILYMIDNYIKQAENQNRLDKDFVKDCFKKLGIEMSDDISLIIDENLRALAEKLIHEDKHLAGAEINTIFDKGDASWLQKQGIDFVGKARFLTRNIAEAFKSRLNVDNEGCEILILKLLFYSKYSHIAFNVIDSIALLDMFQAFAETDSDFSLSQGQLECLLEHIRYLVHSSHISHESITISMKSLIALRKWHFNLVFDRNSLFLSLNGKKYDFPSKLQYQEKIVQLLSFKLKSGVTQSDFAKECRNVADAIKKAGPERGIGYEGCIKDWRS